MPMNLEIKTKTFVDAVIWYTAPAEPLECHPMSGGNGVAGASRVFVLFRSASSKSGFAIHIYALTAGMDDRSLANADGDFLIVPQSGQHWLAPCSFFSPGPPYRKSNIFQKTSHFQRSNPE